MSSLLEVLARAIEQVEKDKAEAEAVAIAERMQDYWLHLSNEAEDWRG